MKESTAVTRLNNVLALPFWLGGDGGTTSKCFQRFSDECVFYCVISILKFPKSVGETKKTVDRTRRIKKNVKIRI